ncbi:MAG: DUF362 domain-containing protein [Candidatus Promineifilaceae bacterium]|jgi:uncharacterized protein (DUF362 family)
MKRREFCRHIAILGGTVVLAPLVKGCTPYVDPTATSESGPQAVPSPTAGATQRPTRTPLPTGTAKIDPTHTPEPAPGDTPQPAATTTASVTPVASAASVALVKTTNRAEGVRRAIELFGLNPVRGSRVLLKPNYNSADPAPGSTHHETMQSLVLQLNELGARSITVGERSGMGATREVLEQMGVFSLGDELGFDTVVFDELEDRDWILRQSADFHWQSGFAVPRILLDSECVVQICNLKTHRYGGHFTMSLKNGVGFAASKLGSKDYMNELHNSSYQRQMIAEINTAYSPSLIVMDGVEAFVDGGPARGTVVSPSVVLAGNDPIAIDAVGVAILRLFGTTPEVSRGTIFQQEQIARAVELGLGIDSPERINLITADPESEGYANQIRQFL